MVSIMPGIDARAPERTETSSGFVGSPNFAPTSLLHLARSRRRSRRRAPSGSFLPFVVEGGADLGGDGEAGRHRQADVGHLGEVGALAAEQVLHLRVAVGLAAAEEVDVLAGLAALTAVAALAAQPWPPPCAAALTPLAEAVLGAFDLARRSLALIFTWRRYAMTLFGAWCFMGEAADLFSVERWHGPVFYSEFVADGQAREFEPFTPPFCGAVARQARPRAGPLLPHGVAVADGHGPVLQALEVDGDAERRADLVLAAVELADGARVVVDGPQTRSACSSRLMPRAISTRRGSFFFSGKTATVIGASRGCRRSTVRVNSSPSFSATPRTFLNTSIRLASASSDSAEQLAAACRAARRRSSRAAATSRALVVGSICFGSRLSTDLREALAPARAAWRLLGRRLLDQRLVVGVAQERQRRAVRARRRLDDVGHDVLLLLLVEVASARRPRRGSPGCGCAPSGRSRCGWRSLRARSTPSGTGTRGRRSAWRSGPARPCPARAGARFSRRMPRSTYHCVRASIQRLVRRLVLARPARSTRSPSARTRACGR